MKLLGFYLISECFIHHKISHVLFNTTRCFQRYYKILPSLAQTPTKLGWDKHHNFSGHPPTHPVTHENSDQNLSEFVSPKFLWCCIRNEISMTLSTSLALLGALTHHLQFCTVCNTKPPASPHYLQNLKWPSGGLKMLDRVWKGVYS